MNRKTTNAKLGRPAKLSDAELLAQSQENAIRLTPIGREILENSTMKRIDPKTIQLIRKT